MASFVSCAVYSVRDHHNLLTCSPLLKKPSIRQVVLDKCFPRNNKQSNTPNKQICVYIYIYIHTCMYVCMHACMHVCLYVCLYVCVYFPPADPHLCPRSRSLIILLINIIININIIIYNTMITN